MSKRGRLKILTVPPSHRAFDEVLTRFFGTRRSKLAAATPAVLAAVHHRIQSNDLFARIAEAEQPEILIFGELISQLTHLQQLRGFGIANSDQATSIAGLALKRIGPNSPFHAVRNMPGFHRAAVDLIAELQHNRVPFSELADLGTKPEAISHSLQDVVDQFEALRVTTGSARLEQLIAVKNPSLEAFNKLFWVGETEWSPLKIAFVEWLIDAGVDVELLAEQHPSNEEFYAQTSRLKLSFPNADYERLNISVPVAANLYGDTTDEEAKVELLAADDRFIETDWVTRRILDRVEKGISPNQIAIFTKSPERYGPLFMASGTRLGVKFAVNWQEPLTANPFCQLLIRSLRCLLDSSPFRLTSLLDEPYFGIPIAERGQIREAIQDLCLSDDAWLKLATHEAVSPCIRALAGAKNVASLGDRTFADWHRWLDSLVASMPWLDQTAIIGEEISDRDAAAKHALVRAMLLSKLAYSTSHRLRLHDFVAQVEEVTENTDYYVRKRGAIPIYSRPGEVKDIKYLFVVGMTEGSFPPRRAEEPILLDKHRLAMLHKRPSLNLQTSYERIEEHRRDFHRLLCKSENITLSWPTSSDTHPEVRSVYILEVLNELKGVQQTTKKLGERFPSAEQARAASDRLVAHFSIGSNMPDDLMPTYLAMRSAAAASDSETIEDERLQHRLAFLPNPIRLIDLRSLYRCRFQYLCRSHFRLHPRRRIAIAEHTAEIIRSANLVHANTLKEIETALSESMEVYLNKLRRNTEREEIALLRFIAPNLLRSFAAREFAARELWSLKPVAQHASITDPYFKTTLKTPRQTLSLDLTVDFLHLRDTSNDPVPMQISWVSKRNDDSDQFQFEAGIIAGMTRATEAHLAIFDSPDNEQRRMITGKLHPNLSILSDFAKGLTVDPRRTKDELKGDIAYRLRHLDVQAATTEFNATKGQHCASCGFASLCRRAQGARFYTAEPDE